jgi:hypothetical protein
MTEISIILGILLVVAILWFSFIATLAFQVLSFLKNNSPFDVVIKDSDVNEKK